MNNIYLLLFLLTLTLFTLGVYYRNKVLKILSIISCIILLIKIIIDIKNKNILENETDYDWSSPISTLIEVSPAK